MKTKLANLRFNYLSFPGYLLFHPFDGFDDFKRYKKAKMSVAISLMILYAFLRIYTYQYEGFLINERNPLLLNSLEEVFSVALLIGLFTIGNWSVTTLMSGKGNFKEIFMVTGYALFPLVIIGFPAVFISNYLTLEEMAFYNLAMGIAYISTGWMLFMGMLNIHNYGLAKTIGAFSATFVSMIVMMFLGLLFFDLIQQFISFVASIYEEISLRY
ncbi:hypothetical protein BN85303900 [Paracholeplasma brassicae]|uniref:Yip1 domain-containing protein n=1 Tax=Acholeplasma brassicae TaxID=61635 RepID=U4KMQ2_9MOLU|nr:YIP1 family protein [Paracholeplasma brassicae]CCV65411.1 hypothetical protein BN85303900 [Paracholeplasma brassicae]